MFLSGKRDLKTINRTPVLTSAEPWKVLLLKRKSLFYPIFLGTVFFLLSMKTAPCLEQLPSGSPESFGQAAASRGSSDATVRSDSSVGRISSPRSNSTALADPLTSGSSLSKEDSSTSRTPLPGPQDKSNNKTAQKRSTLSVLFSMLGSLLLVLGVFFGIVFCLKKILPREKNSLPPELIGCVGQFMLTPKNRLYLVTFGSRLLLLSASPEGLCVLTEVTAPEEVEYFIQCGPKAFTGSSSPLVQEVLDRIRTEQRQRKEASREK